ncbi:MAG: hypothetical protein ACRDWS_14660 [Acidimicrobiia bacterium]
MHNVLLVIHVLSVILWLGSGMGATYIGSRLVRESGTVALAWLRVAEGMGPRLYGPASGLTLLSGIGLVLTSDAYGFGSLFVVLGMAVWVLIAIGNGAYAGPREKRAVQAFESGDEETGRQTLRKLNGFVTVEFLLLVAIVIVMIYRWGA